MELPVMMHDEIVGTCDLEELGLYWNLNCKCKIISDRVERLYVGEKKLGVLEKMDDCLCVKRMLSKASCPELPPQRGYFTLHPEIPEVPMEEECQVKETEQLQEDELWEGEILGYWLKGKRVGDTLLFPYDEAQPCPCEALMCFFEVRDGFWRLPLSITDAERTL